MTMKNKTINWKLVSKEDKKAFKEWLKTEKLLPSKTFLTKFYNTNNNFTVEKKTIEFLVFNFVKLENKYKDAINSEKVVNVSGHDVKEFTRNILVSHLNPKDHNEFSKLVELIFEIMEYKIANVKNVDYEYDLVKKYWNFVHYVKTNYITTFNRWVVLVNKNLYIKQNGFIKK